MKIQNDLDAHSNYIEELFDRSDKQRDRLDVLSEKVSHNTYVLQDVTQRLVEIAKNLKNVDDLISAINTDYLQKKSWVDLLNDLLKKPLKLLYVSSVLLAFLFALGAGLDIEWNIIKEGLHYLFKIF